MKRRASLLAAALVLVCAGTAGAVAVRPVAAPYVPPSCAGVSRETCQDRRLKALEVYAGTLDRRLTALESPAPTPTPTPSPTASPTPSATPSATPTPTPSATASPTPSPTTTPSTWACTTSANKGRCGPYGSHPTITGANSDPWVDQNVWTETAGYRQTLQSNGPTSWQVVANGNFGNGGVLTYPNTGFWMDGTISSKPSITSSWDVTFPHDAQTIGWAAYDLWFNSWAHEVMIITDLSVNQYYDCNSVGSATFAGQPWHLCVFGAQKVWKPGTDDQHLRNQARGSIDVKPMLLWLEQHGHLPVNSTWTAASFGFEICNTSGLDKTWRVNNFTWES